MSKHGYSNTNWDTKTLNAAMGHNLFRLRLEVYMIYSLYINFAIHEHFEERTSIHEAWSVMAVNFNYRIQAKHVKYQDNWAY